MFIMTENLKIMTYERSQVACTWEISWMVTTKCSPSRRLGSRLTF